MSRRIKDLLDEAAAGIEPRNADPVETLVRRGRIARARAVTAAGLAVAAVLTGGTVAGARLAEGDPPPVTPAETAVAPKPATRPDRPPTPRLEQGRIVAGDVTLAVPEGWQAAPIDSAPCVLHRDTVLFGEGTNPWGPRIYCATASVEVQSIYNAFPWVWSVTGDDPAAPDAWQETPVSPWRMVTLDTEAPAWLRTDPDGAYRMVLPWSRVEVTVRGGPDLRRRILDSLKTGRWRPSALALPKYTEYAALTVATGAGGAREVKVTDRAKVKRAQILLRAATVVVRPGDSCVREDQPTVALELGKSPEIPNAPEDMGSVVISLAEGCHEVVAEEGGRVRLDEASLAELGDLFGVRLP